MKVGNRSWFISFSHMTGAKEGLYLLAAQCRHEWRDCTEYAGGKGVYVLCHERMCMNASAPHAYIPMILCDNIPSDRALALQFGLELLKDSDILLICGNRISSGMRGELPMQSAWKCQWLLLMRVYIWKYRKNWQSVAAISGKFAWQGEFSDGYLCSFVISWKRSDVPMKDQLAAASQKLPLYLWIRFGSFVSITRLRERSKNFAMWIW